MNAGVDVLLYSNTVKNRTSLASEMRAILVAEANRDPAFLARDPGELRQDCRIEEEVASERHRTRPR